MWERGQDGPAGSCPPALPTGRSSRMTGPSLASVGSDIQIPRVRHAGVATPGPHPTPSPGAPMRQPNTMPPGPRRSIARRILLHVACLVIALGCLAAYEHFKVEQQSDAAAIFGFVPVRDVLRVVFGLTGRTLHLVHALGSLALVGLPLAGVVSGTPLLTHAAMAPFAIMGAAQAVMHQNHPRNAQQAAAMQRFATSLPEVAQFAGGNLSSPETAKRAFAALS